MVEVHEATIKVVAMREVNRIDLNVYFIGCWRLVITGNGGAGLTVPRDNGFEFHGSFGCLDGFVDRGLWNLRSGTWFRLALQSRRCRFGRCRLLESRRRLQRRTAKQGDPSQEDACLTFSIA